jgi:hypothetical protein
MSDKGVSFRRPPGMEPLRKGIDKRMALSHTGRKLEDIEKHVLPVNAALTKRGVAEEISAALTKESMNIFAGLRKEFELDKLVVNPGASRSTEDVLFAHTIDKVNPNVRKAG